MISKAFEPAGWVKPAVSASHDLLVFLSRLLLISFIADTLIRTVGFTHPTQMKIFRRSLKNVGRVKPHMHQAKKTTC